MIPSFLKFLNKHQITDRKIAVGVSGGSDSLALVLAAHEELSPLGYQVFALTVDHQLRPESAEETQYVAKIMANAGIEHHVLCWQGAKPQTGIEEAARQARYGLMTQWMAEKGIRYLMVAHHLEDQVETFFMRLQRGSGLSGLCGMREAGTRHNITILRPLLEVSKNQLQEYLTQKRIGWVTDQSNFSDDFLRCRIRKFLPQMTAATGISLQTIVATMERLQTSQDYLEKATSKKLQQNFRFYEQAGCCCALSTWRNFDFEIQFRLLGQILKTFSHKDYIPRAKSIMSVMERLNSGDFKAATLSGCEIIVFSHRLWIIKEIRDRHDYRQQLWDQFLERQPQYKKQRLPYKLRLALVYS